MINIKMPDLRVTDETQAFWIKFFAVLTAIPRWIPALMSAEGNAIPGEWKPFWIIFSAVLSGGMAVVEGFAFSFTFKAWRNQEDEAGKANNNILYFSVITAFTFVLVLMPHIVSVVEGVSVKEALWSSRLALYFWAFMVAASNIMIVISVGYAQKVSGRTTQKRATEPALLEAKQKAKDAEARAKEIQAQAEEKVLLLQKQLTDAETRANTAEEIAKVLTDPEKKNRVLQIYNRWPELPGSAIAILAETSQGYVSDTLKEKRNGNGRS